LAEAEEPLTTIEEWQERVVRLDRNQRQSRMEEKMLERIWHVQEEMRSLEETMEEDHMGKAEGK